MTPDLKISVILPVYNGMKYLEKSVLSVINQNIFHYEFIICDDCSTDESTKFLREIEKKYSQKVKVIYNNVNLGLFKTLNKLISFTSSPLIHLWAQDDIMMPDCLEKCIIFHDLHADITMSYHGVEYIDENGTVKPFEKIDGTPIIIDTDSYASMSSKWGCIPGNISNVTISSVHAYAVGLFNDEMILSADFDLWTKLASKGSIGRMTEKLTFLRLHGGQLSRNYGSIALRIKEDIPIQKKISSLLIKNEDQYRIARRYWRWKTQPSYFNDLLFLFYVKEYNEGKKLMLLLKSETNLFGLFMRWSVVRLLRAFKLDIKFYQIFLEK
ncbi:glycosyltransferase [Pedobacter sp. 22163]|uniref:glycosyltransferase n=1 Tax=Pedobacter sp. 22163 TaxID=3453883 RepID=UPI003F868F4B